MRRILVTLISIGATLSVASCGDDIKTVTKCISGRTASCSCETGGSGDKVCGSDERWGACQCSASNTGGTSGFTGSGGRGGATGIGGELGTGGAPPVGNFGKMLHAGEAKLVDVFSASAGIIVVTSDDVTVVDRDGNQLNQWVAPREIGAAAFDGTRLAIADPAFVTLFDTSLARGTQISLTEPCVALELFDADRAVCGNGDSFNRLFYTYNTATGQLLSTSARFTNQGMSIRRVPGKNDFVAVSSGGFSDFYLYTLTRDEVQYIAGSPFDADVEASMVFAFTGVPAQHLIAQDGNRLTIYGEGCAAGQQSPQCFVIDGMLGTLRTGQRFLGLDSDGTSVFALVETSGTSYSTRRCAQGCLVQRIDATAREVQSEKAYGVTEVSSVVRARHDSVGNGLVVGFALSDSVAVSTGHRVELLSYD